jgi:hypothetical protein
MVLAVQERQGRASKVRSADGAAMFNASGYRAVDRLMLSIRSPGVAVTCNYVVVRVPPRDRCQCRPNVKSQASGKTLSLSLLQPVAPEPWTWIDPNSTKRASRFVMDDGLF